MSLATIPFPLYDQLKIKAGTIPQLDINVIDSGLLNARIDRKNCLRIYETLAAIIIRYYIEEYPNSNVQEVFAGLCNFYGANVVVNGTKYLSSMLPVGLLYIIQAYTMSL